MIAFDKYRTALSPSQQLYHANDRSCEHQKTARTQVQRAPKKGWIPAAMGSQGRSRVKEPVWCRQWHKPIPGPASTRRPVTVLGNKLEGIRCHHSVSCSDSRNSYCQQPPRSLGWGNRGCISTPSGNVRSFARKV